MVSGAEGLVGRPRRTPVRRGRSGLHRAGRWATPTRGNPRESATENRPPEPQWSSVETGGVVQVRVKRWCKRPPATRATGSARQTPPGARSNSARSRAARPSARVDRTRPSATAVRDGWSPNGTPQGAREQNPAYRPAPPPYRGHPQASRFLAAVSVQVRYFRYDDVEVFISIALYMILHGLLDADAGHRAAVAGRAGRLAVGRAAALGQQVEPVVAGAGRGVHLLARDRGGVAVVVAGQRRVVHVADRAVADQVDLLADDEVRRVERSRSHTTRWPRRRCPPRTPGCCRRRSRPGCGRPRRGRARGRPRRCEPIHLPAVWVWPIWTWVPS